MENGGEWASLKTGNLARKFNKMLVAAGGMLKLEGGGWQPGLSADPAQSACSLPSVPGRLVPSSDQHKMDNSDHKMVDKMNKCADVLSKNTISVSV